MPAAAAIADLLRGADPTAGTTVDDIARTATDTALLDAVSAMAAGPLAAADAARLRRLGLALLKRIRLEPARHLYLALVRSPHRRRADLLALAHAMMAYRGVWPHDQQPHPAITVLMMQTSLDPDDLDAWMNVVNLWLDSPAALINRDVVLHAIRAVLRLRPDCAEAHYALGMLHQQCDEPQAAARAYEAVLSRDPDHVPARFRLWCLAGADGSPTGTALEPPHPGDAAEIDVPAADPGRARAAYRRWGCVVLRGAIATDAFDAIAGTLVPWLRQRSADGGPIPVDFREVPEDGRRRLLEQLHQPAIAEHVIQSFGDWGGCGWEPVGNSTWWLQWREPGPQRLGSYHLDYPVHADRSDWFTVWMPLVECGPGIAPGLNVVPCNLARPLLFTEHFDHYVNPVPRSDALRYFDPVISRPRFAPGDLLVFRNTTLHGTFNDPDLPGTRLSFDSRFHLGAAPLGFEA